MDRVEVKVVADLGLAADAGGVDRDEGQTIQLEADVDRVAGRAGDFRNDHPFGAGEGVNEGRFAGVRPADNGDLHHLLGGVVRVVGGQLLGDHLEELAAVAVLLRRDIDRRAAAELVEFLGEVFEMRFVGLVDDEDDRPVDVAETLGDLLVERHEPLAAIDHEEDEVGLLHRGLDLLLDVVGQVVAIDHADAAGIDQLDETAPLLLAKLDE